MCFGLFILKTKCIFSVFNLDRMETDFHRFKPNSRIALINEQLNPLLQLQNKAAMNRHRGSKLKRRFERSASIALLSLEFLLFDDQAIIHNKCLVQLSRL